MMVSSSPFLIYLTNSIAIPLSVDALRHAPAITYENGICNSGKEVKAIADPITREILDDVIVISLNMGDPLQHCPKRLVFAKFS